MPLSPRAIAVLREARRYANGTGLVFVGAHGRQIGKGSVGAILHREGLDCVPHGFRSSFGNWVEECTNTPKSVAEAALAHPKPRPKSKHRTYEPTYSTGGAISWKHGQPISVRTQPLPHSQSDRWTMPAERAEVTDKTARRASGDSVAKNRCHHLRRDPSVTDPPSSQLAGDGSIKGQSPLPAAAAPPFPVYLPVYPSTMQLHERDETSWEP